MNKKIPSFIANYLKLISFVTAIIGTGLLVVPTIAVNLFFTIPSDQAVFFVRIIGSTLLGYAALNGFAANHAKNYELIKVVIWANLVTLLTASLLSIGYAYIFDTNAWLIIAQHLLFAVGFLYSLRILPKNNL